MLAKRLLRPAEISRYIAFNQTNSGATAAVDYLTGASIWIFYRPATPDQWVAAYAINTRAPFRCLSLISPEQRTKALSQHGLAENRLVEITLLSRDRSQGWLPGERDYYYRMSIVDALKTGRRHLLGGTTDADLLRFQQQVLSRVLFDGELNVFGQPHHGWLIYASWLGAVGNALWYITRQVGAALLPRRRQSGRRPVANG
ncbi:hypothetical protein [Fibrella aquatilis]|uniref:Uncharacterized protein n=1 Tax=Fibrella aquatilis TaxID=2817059 RepID=A0A939K286_9BACT|nr:hypothetical protein [Fibrella aquatilis]MBO0933836.1 hypothetical protein [Fibrella aquatilis]